MTDPERISKRSSGLAARLLQAGGDEQPAAAGVERTLLALGVSGAALTTALAANAAAASGVKMTGAAIGSAAGVSAAGVAGSATKVVTATVLAKWIGVGVLGGVTLSGAAALMSAPAAPVAAPAPQVAAPTPQVAPVAAAPSAPAGSATAPAAPAAEPAPVVAAPVVAPSHAAPAELVESELVLEVGAPLAAEVAFIDGARALLAAGLAEQGLSQLLRYEQEFPQARLLPEVLFLRLETCDRLGRSSEARAAATRLVQGFPQSPHAARARKLLGR
jgi:hypothetical protein